MSFLAYQEPLETKLSTKINKSFQIKLVSLVCLRSSQILGAQSLYASRHMTRKRVRGIVSQQFQQHRSDRVCAVLDRT